MSFMRMVGRLESIVLRGIIGESVNVSGIKKPASILILCHLCERLRVVVFVATSVLTFCSTYIMPNWETSHCRLRRETLTSGMQWEGMAA